VHGHRQVDGPFDYGNCEPPSAKTPCDIDDEPKSLYVAFLAGWGAMRVIALVPFLGGIAWLVATVLGLGTLWVAARAPTEVGPVAPPLAPPPPVPS
jgi:hypothetical protein